VALERVVRTPSDNEAVSFAAVTEPAPATVIVRWFDGVSV
jgi:hypothetical protein